MAAKPRATPLQVCEHCRREFSSRARWCPHCNLAVGEPIRMHEEVAYGVTFRNDDGIERQEVLHRLARRPCDLELVREADNPRDPSAVGIFCRFGQLGYLGRDLASSVAETIDAGCGATALLAGIEDISAHGYDDGTLGVRIVVLQHAPDVGREELETYAATNSRRWQYVAPATKRASGFRRLLDRWLGNA